MKSLSKTSIKAIEEIRDLTKGDKKLVFVSGNFNIIHPGHIRLLRFAAECGTFLIVGVNGAGANGVIVSEEHRLDGIKDLLFIDHSFILNDQPADFIGELKPDIVVKGKEHEDWYNPEYNVVKEYGGKLLFASGEVTFSSLDLIKKEFFDIDLSTIKKPVEFPNRHGFKIQDLISVVDAFKNLTVCVLGELIVDEYITCEPIGMSQEDPTIVVRPILSQKFIGGAGIVASHARSLGAKVQFFSVTGKDHVADFARDKLDEYEVENFLYEDENRPTILKQRFRAGDKTLLRVNHLRQHEITKEMQKKIIADVASQLDEIDLLIFSDFNYGLLTQYMVDSIIGLCKQKDIMMVADSQSSSQFGDISRYNEMKLITPTEREARLAVRDFTSGLVSIAELLQKKCNVKHIAITLGKEGVLVHSNNHPAEEWITDKLSAFNQTPKDTAGAGDSFLVCTSMALAVGCNIWQSTYLGSLASACQVSRLGNIPLTLEDFKSEIKVDTNIFIDVKNQINE